MEPLVPLLAAAALAALLAPGTLRMLAAAGFTRPNFRGIELPFPAGVAAVAAGVLAAGALTALDRLAGTHVLAPGPLADALVLGLGTALLGLVDDVFSGPSRGWRGHARAVLRGELSTGALKAAGTLALALVVLAGHGLSTGEYLLAVAVLALTTNLFNLLDLRPGRAVKAFVLLGAGLLAGTGDAEPLRAIGLFAGPLLVLGAFDLRERAMLGDTGANLLGAMAGLWLVTALGVAGQLVALAVLLAITLYGEIFSLSAAVERIPPLRALDWLGRKSDA
jgi:hypothetical protein